MQYLHAWASAWPVVPPLGVAAATWRRWWPALCRALGLEEEL